MPGKNVAIYLTCFCKNRTIKTKLTLIWAPGDPPCVNFPPSTYWFFTKLALWPFWSCSRNVHLFFSRPLIGPQITWSDPGLSLVYQNSVSLMGTLKRSITCTITCNLLMAPLMRTLKRSITWNLLMKKCVPDGHLNSVSLMKTRPWSAISWWKNVLLTAIRTLSPWWELVHNLQSPYEKNISFLVEKSLGGCSKNKKRGSGGCKIIAISPINNASRKKVLVLLSASVNTFGVSCMRDFCLLLMEDIYDY